VVAAGLIDDRHDSNQELVGQGVANLVGPLFGCIPVTGAVARSVVNVRSGGRTPVAGIAHAGFMLLLLVLASPLIGHIPLATLSAVLVVAAYRMVAWKQFARLTRWPLSDSSVFLATFALTVLTNLTLAVEVGVVLAALLMVKRISETSKITAVDESTETEGSQHSLVGKTVPEGVLIFRVFGAFFFGVVDKLDDELKRAKREPDILILRVRKVLAMDAPGLQALGDLRAKLPAQGQPPWGGVCPVTFNPGPGGGQGGVVRCNGVPKRAGAPGRRGKPGMAISRTRKRIGGANAAPVLV